MRLPQFTAEASLGKSSKHYRLSSGTSTSSATIAPHMVFGGIHWVPTEQVLVCWSDGICIFQTVFVNPLSLGPTSGVGVTGSGIVTGSNTGVTGRTGSNTGVTGRNLT
jgi:hypothetical protein